MDEEEDVLVDRLVQSNNKFALKLFKKVAAHCSNILLSPVSVSSVLTMLLVGAKGDTETQIKELLHLEDISLTTDEDNGNDNANANANSQIHLTLRNLLESLSTSETGVSGLTAAHRLYLQEDVPFDQSASAYLRDTYGEELGCVDFARAVEEARAQINAWIAEKVAINSWKRGLVGEGVLDLFTTLVAISASTFQGEWEIPFDGNATCLHPFRAGGGREIIVDLMHTRKNNGEFRTAYDDDLACQLVELPYKEDRFALLLIIPTEHEEFHAIEDKMNVEMLDALVGQLQPSTAKIALPRFRVACTFSMSDLIGDMGANLVLDPDTADLTGFTDSNEEGVCLSALIHGTELRVVEKGTERLPSTPQDEEEEEEGESEEDENEVVVDRPFIFVLRDKKSGLILFIGCIHEPSAEEM